MYARLVDSLNHVVCEAGIFFDYLCPPNSESMAILYACAFLYAERLQLFDERLIM